MDASEWRRRLQDGERVRLYPGAVLVAIPIPIATGFAIMLLWVCYGIIRLLAFGVPFSEANPRDPVLLVPLGAAPLWLLLTCYLWGTALFPAVQLSGDGFDFWSWRRRRTHVKRANIDALAWFYPPGGPGRDVVASLYIRVGASSSGRPRWMHIGGSASRMDLMESLGEEIVAVCSLTGPVERKRRFGVETVWKRLAEEDVPPISRLC
ncbi:MAG: hypothetical protein JSV65_00470 [Armatimonadota bacterium]|nr:MAG: hypothetical protein JSV65_00470 [Armatimonadota bacterium]